MVLASPFSLSLLFQMGHALPAGVTSKSPRLSMEQSAAESDGPTANAGPAADTWLSSPDVDLDGLEGSWNSVSQLEIPEGYERPPVSRHSLLAAGLLRLLGWAPYKA
jgi:hypothetical protein